MNDETKEILDKLKDNDWYDELDLTGDKWIELKQTETKQILDYITNLQQKYEEADYDRHKLFEENERLKENNSDMQEEMARTWEKCDDYKSRCGKASEYIDKQKKKIYKSRNKIAMFILMKLENILQNGSDE